MKASAFVPAVISAYETGCGYIWGTYGQLWTETLQKKGSRQNNDRTQAYGRRWLGYSVYDCSGLPYAMAKALGVSIPHGCNSVWKGGYLSEKGRCAALAPEKRLPGMLVFLTRGSDRHHMGVYIGGGLVVESKGTQYGVVVSAWEHWDEYGVLRGMEHDLPVDFAPVFNFAAEPPRNGFVTCRKGSVGPSVRYVQVLLRTRWNVPLTVDSTFGDATLEAVRAFQTAQGLAVDGVVGTKTIAALEQGTPPAMETVVPADNALDKLERCLNEALALIREVKGA